MGLQNQFNDIIKRHLSVYAAWLPIANAYTLGDYGIFNDGVFVKMGNIGEFGIAIEEENGEDATLDFTSEDTIVTHTGVAAQVQVNPALGIGGDVKFTFQKERSFLLKVPVIKVKQIKNVNQVGTKLKEEPKWENRFKVVYQTYHAEDAVLISNISAGTELTFNLDLTLVQVLKGASANLKMETNKALGLNITGKKGVIGLGLFKLNLLNRINILSTDVVEQEGKGLVLELEPSEGVDEKDL